MKKEKSIILPALITAVLTALLFFEIHSAGFLVEHEKPHVTVGFLCDGDESTPYSENFLRVADTLSTMYGDRVTTVSRTNVPYDYTGNVLKELIDDGCDIIVSNTFDNDGTVKEVAADYPNVQFCQADCLNANEEPFLENYHTFMGEIYEGRYAAGKIAGLKINEMIDKGIITESKALVGYVAAFEYPEVISGYTAFLLGVRSVCPSAEMKVRYTNTWSDYSLEKETATLLINEGCVVISQHSDTIGPAVACENSKQSHPVYHVGYNQDMQDVAPNTSLIGTRVDWTPYIVSAVEAVFANKDIEVVVDGHKHGNDIGGGFKEGWVNMLELNHTIAPENAEQVLSDTIESFRKGEIKVFYGDYQGIGAEDPNDRIDLNTPYYECKDHSSSTFNYILRDVITIE